MDNTYFWDQIKFYYYFAQMTFATQHTSNNLHAKNSNKNKSSMGIILWNGFFSPCFTDKAFLKDTHNFNQYTI